MNETFLVSSPGFRVLDSSCGKTIIGLETLQQFQNMWQAQGITLPEPDKEINHFKYGNGQHEVSQQSIKMPVFVGGRRSIIKAAIVRGSAPLLISRPALRALQLKIPLATNAAGQYVLNLMGSERSDSGAEVAAKS